MRVVELQDGFGLEHLHCVERPEPVAGPGEILVRMRAWSLNYRDWLMVQGQYNPKLKFPYVPLSDGVGEIAAVGAGVDSRRIGERVATVLVPAWQTGQVTEAALKGTTGGGVPGVLAETIVLPASAVIPVPDYLSDTGAATLPCAALTAWNALAGTGRLSAGQSVLIQGTGGVSYFAVHFAHWIGARIIATTTRASKVSILRDWGVTDIICTEDTPDWDKAVRQLTDGLGVDQVVEVGGAGTLGRSLKAVKAGGTISLIGVLSGNQAEFNPVPILMRHICLQGIFAGSTEMFADMNAALAEHRFEPLVNRVFDMADLPQALDYLHSGQHVGKVCLTR